MSWSGLFGRRRSPREWNEELRRLKFGAKQEASGEAEASNAAKQASAEHTPEASKPEFPPHEVSSNRDKEPLTRLRLELAGDGHAEDALPEFPEASEEAKAEAAEAEAPDRAAALTDVAAEAVSARPQASLADATPGREGARQEPPRPKQEPAAEQPGASVDRGGVPPAARDPRAASLPEGAFMPELAEMFEDEVVMALLYGGAVRLDQIARAIVLRRRQPEQKLWRCLLEVPGVDRETVLAEAARVGGIAPAPVDEERPSVEFIKAILLLLPPSVQHTLFDRQLLPCGFAQGKESGRVLLLATHDPTRPELEEVVRQLGMPVELRYAPERILTKRLTELESFRPPVLEPEPPVSETQPQVRAPEPEAEKTPIQPETESPEHAFETPTPDATDTDSVREAAPPKSPKDDEPDEGVGLEETAASEPAAPEVRPAEEVPATFAREASPAAESPVESLFEPLTDETLEEPKAEATPDAQAEAALETEPEVAVETLDAAADAVGDEKQEADASETADDGENVPPPVKIVLDDLPELKAAIARDRVVSRLLEKDMVALHQVYQAYQRQQDEGLKEPLWRVLAQSDHVPQDAIYEEAARLYAFPIAKLEPGKPSPEFVRSVMDTFEEEVRERLIELRVVPFEVDLDAQTGAVKLVLVTHDPMRPEVHRLVHRLKLERFELQYAPRGVIMQALMEAYPRRNEYLERVQEEAAYDLGTSYDTEAELIDEDALEAEINRSKLINLFEATLVEAVRQGASDIHIFPNNQKKVEIHFRIDGRLTRWHVEDKVHPEAFIAVIKDQSMNVDRFERDAAQDGFIQRWIDDHLIRFRVSVLPIANALEDLRSESIVIRVLDDRKVIKDLRLLGLNKRALERFERAIRQPHGMVIVTGPTGSGKSTTLYAALHQVVSPEVNVLTIEDPVEYIIPGVRQIKLNHKLGLEDALRAILRHDPDIVMVGEMRDRQTAELAIKLANTGHLTFSTLHTNDAPSAVSRLYKMGIEPFLIAYAINLVVAQRLIRKVCPACKVEDKDPDYVMLRKLGFTDEEIEHTTFYKAGRDRNCKICKGVGYKGRRAIVEAMYFSRTIRHMIVEAQGTIDEDALREQAIKEGMQTLRDAAREVVLAGETTVEEMIRVTTTDE